MRDEATDVLLERIRGGESRAYEVLFLRYEAPLRAFVHRRASPALRTRLDIDDLVQEIHLRALRSLEGFTWRRELSFYFWLCTIARHLIANHYRGLSRKPPPLRLSGHGLGHSGELLGLIRDEGPGPVSLAEQNEALEVLALAITDLSPRRRTALMLRHVEGRSNAEAAAALGISDGAFRVLLSRATSDLRTGLAQMLGEEP